MQSIASKAHLNKDDQNDQSTGEVLLVVLGPEGGWAAAYFALLQQSTSFRCFVDMQPATRILSFSPLTYVHVSSALSK